MEKNTISHYAWIVVLCIILSIMIAMSTPITKSFASSIMNATVDFSVKASSRLPFTYEKEIQKGGWEYEVIGGTPNEYPDMNMDIDENNLVKTIVLTKYLGPPKRILKIPNLYTDETTGKTMVVAGIGKLFDLPSEGVSEKDNVFGEKNTPIKHLIVSKGVNVQVGAFNNVENLENVILAPGNDVISDYAFAGCKNLKSIQCGEDNAFIGNYAFANCVNLREVLFGKNLNSLGDYAFYNCELLRFSEDLPASLEFIGNRTFQNCKSISNLNFEHTQLKSIGDYAFYGCASVSGSIKLPNTVKMLGEYVFENCGKLTGTFYVPEELEIIGDNCFKGSNFSKVEFSTAKNLRYIGNYAFENCDRLSGSLYFPDTLEYIGKHAFYNCRSISNIVLPERLVGIGEDAFYNMTGLKIHELIIPGSCVHFGGSIKYNKETHGIEFIESSKQTISNNLSLKYMSKINIPT